MSNIWDNDADKVWDDFYPTISKEEVKEKAILLNQQEYDKDMNELINNL